MYCKRSMFALVCSGLLILSMFVGNTARDARAVVFNGIDVPVVFQPLSDQIRPRIAVYTGSVPHIIHVVWEDYRNGDPDIFYSKSDDNGVTFSTAIRVNHVTTGVQRQPSVAVDGLGNVHVVWADESNPLWETKTQIFYAKAVPPFDVFGPNIQVSEDVGPLTPPPDLLYRAGPTIAIDNLSPCNVHVSWYLIETKVIETAQHGVYYDKDTSCSGQSFDFDINLNMDGYHPSIAVDSMNNAHIAYVKADEGIYHVELYTGGGFSFPSRVNDNGVAGLEPSIAVSPDPSDHIHVAWRDYRNWNFNDNFDIFYAKSTDGGSTFGADVRVDDDNTYAGQGMPSIGVDEFGNPHVVWTDFRDDLTDPWYAPGGGNDGVDNGNIYHSESSDGGATFGPNQPVNDIYFSYIDREQSYPSIAAIGGSTLPLVVHVVWQDGRLPDNGFDVFYDKSNYLPVLEPCGLSWSGNCGEDGIEPEMGDIWRLYTYCVIYRDEDNDPPAAGEPKLHIKDAGVPIGVYSMYPDPGGGWLGPPGNYKDGRMYVYSKDFTQEGRGTDYTYYFTAVDSAGSVAVPTPEYDGPEIVLNEWIPRGVAATHPHERYGHALAYESQEVILFGGRHQAIYFDDTWRLDSLGDWVGQGIPAQWQQITTSTQPSPREGHSMIGIGNGWILLFGGTDGANTFDDTWIFDVNSGTWTLTAPITYPQARHDAFMAFDPSPGGGALLFGGLSDVGWYAETWKYVPGATPNDGTWMPVAFGGPEPRASHGIVFDEKHGKFLLYGGIGPGTTEYQDTWTFTWNTLWEPECVDPDCVPAQSEGYGIAHDTEYDLTVLYGALGSLPPHDETYLYDMDNDPIRFWTEVTPISPPNYNPGKRHEHAMVYSEYHHLVIMFGGLRYTGGGDQPMADTWTYEYD